MPPPEAPAPLETSDAVPKVNATVQAYTHRFGLQILKSSKTASTNKDWILDKRFSSSSLYEYKMLLDSPSSPKHVCHTFGWHKNLLTPHCLEPDEVWPKRIPLPLRHWINKGRRQLSFWNSSRKGGNYPFETLQGKEATSLLSLFVHTF